MFKHLNKKQIIAFIIIEVCALGGIICSIVSNNWQACIWALATGLAYTTWIEITAERNMLSDLVDDLSKHANDALSLAQELNDDRKQVVMEKFELLAYKHTVQNILKYNDSDEYTHLNKRIDEEAERLWERIKHESLDKISAQIYADDNSEVPAENTQILE